MKIKTKFNIGEDVYSEFYQSVGEVTTITIEVYPNLPPKIWYDVEFDEFDRTCSEGALARWKGNT